MAQFTSEKHVKAAVKKLLDKHGYFWWMPAGSGFGTPGNGDFNAFKDGVFLLIETKFGKNRPSHLQCAFAGHIVANSGIALCINEDMLGVLDIFLENFTEAARCERTETPIPPEVGARMLNATDIMTDMWKRPK